MCAFPLCSLNILDGQDSKYKYYLNKILIYFPVYLFFPFINRLEHYTGIQNSSTLYRGKKNLISLYFQIQINRFFLIFKNALGIEFRFLPFISCCGSERFDAFDKNKGATQYYFTSLHFRGHVAFGSGTDSGFWVNALLCYFHSQVQQKTKEHWSLNQCHFPLWQQLKECSSSPSAGVSLGCRDALPVHQEPQTHCLCH